MRDDRAVTVHPPRAVNLEGWYVADLSGDRWTWDPRLQALLGADVATTESLLGAIHPDDREHVATALQHAREHGAPYSCEHRVVRPDGSIRQVMTIGEVLADSDGTAVAMRGSMTDITDRHRLEESWARALSENGVVDDRSGVEQMRRYALPDRLPKLAGAEVAARYLSATRGGRVCGDFYYVGLLDDETLMVLIGDVAGHGVAAAGAMSRLSLLFRSFAAPGVRPAHLLRQVNTVFHTAAPGSLATAVYATLRLDTGELTWAAAGHPPPVLVNGPAVRLLTEPRNLMLGVNPEAPYTDETLDLPAGSTLVLYTDGLVERHDRPMDAGTAQLAQLCLNWSAAGPERCCDELLAEFGAGDREDDLCLVTICR